MASTLVVIGVLAGCAPEKPASGGGTSDSGAAPSDAASRARATQRVLNSLRTRGHHNARRPRHATNG